MSSAIDTLSKPLTLPCGLVMPNRFSKCPMQETLASLPFYDPPVHAFKNIYGIWSKAQFGLIITGQVQVDIRFLSVAGDVVVRPESLEEPTLALWREWATVAQAHGTPCIVQLAHPGRMSPKGAGIRPADMKPISASDISVNLGSDTENKFVDSWLGVPQAATIEQIDEVVAAFVNGARVAQAAGFAGSQVHAAHGFLVSQFLSPYTNRRTDDYGGSPAGRLKLLQRIVTETRAACPVPFCLSVKLNSGDYMKGGLGLLQEEALEQVRWLLTCGLVDLVEISGGNAEASSTGTSRLHAALRAKSLGTAPPPPVKDSTRIRECFFTDFAEKVKAIETNVPVQLSGGFRSRLGMADAVNSGVCSVVGLGRAVVLQPSLPREILLNPAIPDDEALATPHIVKGLWVTRLGVLPKLVGMGLPLQFFYYNMRRLGSGLNADPHTSLVYLVWLRMFAQFKAKYRFLLFWRK